MAFTQNLLLNNPTPGDPAQKNAWGTMENTGRTLVDATYGPFSLSIAGSGITVLTSTQGAPDQSRYGHYNFTGALIGAATVLWPQSAGRMFSVTNNTTGAFTLSLGANNGSGAAGGATIIIPQGVTALVYSDGTNVVWRQVGFGANQPMNTYKFTGLGDANGSGQAIVYNQSLDAAILGNFACSNITCSPAGFGTFTSNGFGTTTAFNGSGITTTNGSGFQVTCVSAGVILANNATSWSAVSERIKKKDIQEIPGDPFVIIAAHQVALFRYFDDTEDRPLRPGVFYDDAIKAYPWATTTVPEHERVHTYEDPKTGEITKLVETVPEFKGLSLEQYVPLLLLAIQKLNERVKVLEARAA